MLNRRLKTKVVASELSAHQSSLALDHNVDNKCKLPTQ